MRVAEVLRAKSSEYELLAEWHGERAPLDDDHSAACQAMLAVGSLCGRWQKPWTWSGGMQMPTETRRRPLLHRHETGTTWYGDGIRGTGSVAPPVN